MSVLNSKQDGWWSWAGGWSTCRPALHVQGVGSKHTCVRAVMLSISSWRVKNGFYSGLLLSTLNSSWRRFLFIKKKIYMEKIIDTWNQWCECKVRMAFLIYVLTNRRNDWTWKLSILSALSIEVITEIVLSLSHLLTWVCHLAEMVLKTFICG